MTAATPFSPSFSSKNSLILSPRHQNNFSQSYNSPRKLFYGISCTEKNILTTYAYMAMYPLHRYLYCCRNTTYSVSSKHSFFFTVHFIFSTQKPSLSKALLPPTIVIFSSSLSSRTKILSLEEGGRRRRRRMSVYKAAFLNEQLSKRTSIFGLRLWVVLGVCVGAAFVLLLFLISLWFISKRNKSSQNNSTKKPTIPNVSKEIQEIRVVDHVRNSTHHQDFKSHHQTQVSLNPLPEADHPINPTEHQALLLHPEEDNLSGLQRIHIEIGKDHRISYPGSGGGGGGGVGGGSSHGSGETRSVDQIPVGIPEVSHLGWGHWYTLRELEASTDGFADENVIGEGGYGIVYRGLLVDNTHVAIKNLLNNRGQAEKEFKVEVEAIGRVRHKNLVRLLGYCAEGAHRMLVYEYVDNGNLEQWLHGDVGPVSPLTWDIRTNIILGTAKGLTYLHEGLEPKVVHRDVKSSNILLDRQWNPKVSDFGLAKLLGSESSYVTTRVMGTFGYVAPEYASTGMLNERSDVYSFGILIMEIISGRSPVDYSRPPGEVNLVEWLKTMVSNRNAEGVLDPKIPEKPSSRALKRALLVALRCVDPDAPKRPKMGHVIHMLEADDFPYRDERRNNGRDPGRVQHDNLKRVSESGDSSGCESGTQVNRTGLRKPESSNEHLVDEKLK